MTLYVSPPRHRFPVSIISQALWTYHRFNHNYKDIRDEFAFRGINVSHETIRKWCVKFANHFHDVIKKRERNPTDKWRLDKMCINVNGDPFILWRAVDSKGYELDILLQKRRNKEAATRFLSRLLNSYPTPRVIVTDKLKSYRKPIQMMCRQTEHRYHKRLNNRVENAHQPTRRKEKYLIEFKAPQGVQKTLSLMDKVRNVFAVGVGRYTKKASERKAAFAAACVIWIEADQQLLCV